MTDRTPAEVAESLAKLPETLIRKVIPNSIRRGARRGAAAGRKAVREKGLGLELWKNRNSKRKGITGTPPLIVKSNRVKRSGDSYTGGIEARGVAALIDQGGSIKPHRIEAKLADRLAFQVNGKWSRPKAVMHPGGPVQQNHFMPDAAREAIEEIGLALDTDVDAAVKAAGL